MKSTYRLFHGSPHLETILNTQDIVCRNKLDGKSELECRKEYDRIVGVIAEYAKSYVRKNGSDMPLKSDEELASYARHGIKIIPLIKHISGSKFSINISAKKLRENSVFYDLAKLYDELTKLIESNHISVAKEKETSVDYTTERGNRPSSNIKGVLELDLPIDSVKEKITWHPMVWWNIDLDASIVKSIYIKSAPKDWVDILITKGYTSIPITYY